MLTKIVVSLIVITGIIMIVDSIMFDEIPPDSVK